LIKTKYTNNIEQENNTNDNKYQSIKELDRNKIEKAYTPKYEYISTSNNYKNQRNQCRIQLLDNTKQTKATKKTTNDNIEQLTKNNNNYYKLIDQNEDKEINQIDLSYYKYNGTRSNNENQKSKDSNNPPAIIKQYNTTNCKTSPSNTKQITETNDIYYHYIKDVKNNNIDKEHIPKYEYNIIRNTTENQKVNSEIYVSATRNHSKIIKKNTKFIEQKIILTAMD
jgi:hypothetical protein